MMAFVCFVYLSVLLLTFGSVSLLGQLILLEVLSWIFVVMVPSVFTLRYLIVQRYFLIFRLLGVTCVCSILVFTFLMKLGLPPFHMWFLRMSFLLEKRTFVFIITLHKLFPIFFFGVIMFRVMSFRFVFISLFFVGLELMGRSSLYFTLVFSSMAHRVWMVSRILLSKRFVIFYWILYRRLLLVFVRFLWGLKITHAFFVERFFISMCWLLISGIPPFMVFWIKVYIIMLFIFFFGTLLWCSVDVG